MDNISQFEDPNTLEHEARQWLVRLDRDEPLLEQEKQALQLWMARSPAHQQELTRLAEFWDSSNILAELLIPMHQVAAASRRYHSNSRSPWGLINRFLTPRGGAVLAMGLLLAVFTLRDYLMPVPLDASNGIYAAAIGELREETLADGSVLQINTDSQVQVDFSEQVRKIRLLQGEAHFEVAHNTEWPFEVYAGKGMVKAVGTAFLVRLEEDRLNVIVTDGRVDLVATGAVENDSSKPPDSVTEALPALKKVGSLSQGEGALFSPADNSKAHKVLAQKEMARQLSWREGYLVFEGEPLSIVVAELNRYLPIDVEIADQTLGDIPVGGRFKVEELDALFGVLETSFDIRVIRSGDQRIQLFSKLDQKK
jgi:transmembrane sensor